MNNLMIDGVTNIDEDLIEKYFKLKEKYCYKRKNKKFNQLIKFGSIAACFCVIIAISFLVIPSMIPHTVENETCVTMLGGQVKSSWGFITYTENNYDLSRISFVLEKETNDPFYIEFRGYNITREWVDDDNIPHKEREHYAIITPFDKYENKQSFDVINDKLVIYVNGVQVDNLPIEPGKYEITIDYSALYNLLDYVDSSVYVYNYGRFLLIEPQNSN